MRSTSASDHKLRHEGLTVLGFGSRHATPDELAKHSPIIIMSRGHSGTRLLAWAMEALGIDLGTRAEVATGDAQDRRFTLVISRLARARVGRPVGSPATGSELRGFRRAVGRYHDEWIAQNANATEWGWKFPETYLIPEIVNEVFPLARYVHLLRDGRDVAFKVHDTDNPRKRIGRRIIRQVDATAQPHDLQAALSWQYQVARFREFQPRIADRVCEVRFEDLCDNSEATMTRLAEQLGLPMTDRCREYLRENVQAGKVAQHRAADPVRVRAVEAAIGERLAAEGYACEVRA